MNDFQISDPLEADRLVHLIASDWRQAPLSNQNQTLCEFAEKLTSEPSSMVAADINRLRTAEFNDQAIHDATQVIGYFNYINRLADALHVDLEDRVHAWEQTPPPMANDSIS